MSISHASDYFHQIDQSPWPLQDMLQWAPLVEWMKHFRRGEMVIFSLNSTWTWFQTTFFMMWVYCQCFEEKIKNLRDIFMSFHASMKRMGRMCNKKGHRHDINTASWLLHPWHSFPSIQEWLPGAAFEVSCLHWFHRRRVFFVQRASMHAFAEKLYPFISWEFIRYIEHLSHSIACKTIASGPLGGHIQDSCLLVLITSCKV